MKSPCAAIVQPFSGGKLLAAELSARGWEVVPVIADTDSGRGLDPYMFPYVIPHDSDVPATAETLALADVKAVVAGDDRGVWLADELAKTLGLPGNDPSSSAVRRDKSKMMEALKASGIPAPGSSVAASLADAISAAAVIGWPVIVKPTESAGSDGVRLCMNQAALGQAFAASHRKVNRMGAFNEVLLVQEALVGDQFTCNTVSVAGQHYVTDVWREYRRTVNDGFIVYDYRELTSSNSPDASLAVGYAFQVLDAVGVVNGPAHTELILTSRGPLLVETAARPTGSYIPGAVTAGVGQNQISVAADVITGQETMDGLQMRPSTIHQCVREIFLISESDGMVDGKELAKIFELPTFYSITGRIGAGLAVERTTDLFNSVGGVYLVGDQCQVNEDHCDIRRLEESGLYGEPSGRSY
jgi:biotin carboxylase